MLHTRGSFYYGIGGGPLAQCRGLRPRPRGQLGVTCQRGKESSGIYTTRRTSIKTRTLSQFGTRKKQNIITTAIHSTNRASITASEQQPASSQTESRYIPNHYNTTKPPYSHKQPCAGTVTTTMLAATPPRMSSRAPARPTRPATPETSRAVFSTSAPTAGRAATTKTRRARRRARSAKHRNICPLLYVQGGRGLVGKGLSSWLLDR
ncbi:hypothetical protein B0I37DRAFT_117112 [Chaetomium sp. MPI-CAGE-AT-0009]|nr:hypothetical protein B0I37DRAFT_117112 [Chaetomium sp. MPI-CAGE-AT-0009]